MERTLKPQKKFPEKSAAPKRQTTTGKNELSANDFGIPAEKDFSRKKISAAASNNSDGNQSQNSFIPELTPATDDQVPPPIFASLPLLGNFLATNPAITTPTAVPVAAGKDGFAQATTAPVAETKTAGQAYELERQSAGGLIPSAQTSPSGSQRSSFLTALMPEAQNATPAAGLEISAKDFAAVANTPEAAVAACLAESKPEISQRVPVESFATNEKIKTGAPAEISATQTAGTGVATDGVQMKKTGNENKVAGLDEQVLPGGTNGTAREAVTSPHPSLTPIRTLENKNSDFNLPLTAVTTPATDRSDSPNIIALPSLADTRMREVERTHDLVSLHAVRMVETKADSVSVVIRPSAGTELSLELRHRNGMVEAAAVLQRGDFQLMNQHWPELQQKLEQRGIKLSALGGEGNFSTTDNGNFSQRQQPSSEEAAQQASAFADFTVAMNRGGATARLAPVTPDGWESWA